jgi:UDP-glucuronate decarboxylase
MALNDGRVVSNFIVQALKNENITVYGNGDQTRSFCYVDDLILGIEKLFFAEEVFEPINLGNPMPISIQELANEIIKLTGSKSTIEYLPLPLDDPSNRHPDISTAKNILEWSPNIDRTDGLKNTILYFKQRLKSV